MQSLRRANRSCWKISSLLNSFQPTVASTGAQFTPANKTSPQALGANPLFGLAGMLRVNCRLFCLLYPKNAMRLMPTTFHQIPRERPVTPLLDRASTPDGLRRLAEAELEGLADELRQYLLYTVGQTGGHFGAGLGVIELTIALHYVFDTPD